MDLIDFDGMFDKKLTEYMENNKNKFTEKQWEDLIPSLYQKFGDSVIPKINCTPREYYEKMNDDELIATLSAHLKHNVPVSDFLCSEIENRDNSLALLKLLDSDNGETVSYAINLIGPKDEAMEKYLSIITENKFDEDIRDAVVDQIKENADAVLESAVKSYKEGKAKEYMLEILSRTKTRNDEVYQILLDEFLSDAEKIPMHASYLAAYGDERALPYLMKKIEDRTINFVEFQELKYAVEALGGEYNEPRDFRDDNDFKLIEEASLKEGFNQKN